MDSIESDLSLGHLNLEHLHQDAFFDDIWPSLPRPPDASRRHVTDSCFPPERPASAAFKLPRRIRPKNERSADCRAKAIYHPPLRNAQVPGSLRKDQSYNRILSWVCIPARDAAVAARPASVSPAAPVAKSTTERALAHLVFVEPIKPFATPAQTLRFQRPSPRSGPDVSTRIPPKPRRSIA